jgi:3-oxoacyl-[acyl-carrier protein] reductase
MLSALQGKVAIITGAGRGIGKAFALRFAEEGASLLLPDISVERAESVAREIRAKGSHAEAVKTDISSEADTQAMADKVMALFGRVDILVNNAALYYGLSYKPWHAWTVEEWQRIDTVNVIGTWLCCKVIAPLMIKQQKGKIINIASDIIKNPGGQGLLPYACSKGAVRTMTEMLARALGTHGINVNAIAPGYTNTEASLSLEEKYEDTFKMVISGQAIHRKEEPEDLVGAAVFLASKDSDFVTGQLIPVNGGAWMV